MSIRPVEGRSLATVRLFAFAAHTARPSLVTNVLISSGTPGGPTWVTALQFLVPPLAVVMAAVFLSEPIRPEQVIGGAVILAGIALLRRGTWPGQPSRGARVQAPEPAA